MVWVNPKAADKILFCVPHGMDRVGTTKAPVVAGKAFDVRGGSSGRGWVGGGGEGGLGR